MRGRCRESELRGDILSPAERPPHPIPLPARGEREEIPLPSSLRAYIAASARAMTSAGLSSAPRSTTPAEAPTTSVDELQRTGVPYTAASSAPALAAALVPLTFHNS